MADEIIAEVKAKKPGILRRIVWGLWVLFLSALLVLGLVFAAPWKVITLIAIFFAAATILPRIYRKWFWLGAGIVVLAVIAWIFLPDDNKDWRPYQFDKELAQLQARYAVPDSENAAILYNQILADWKQKEANEPNLPVYWSYPSLKGPWLSKDQPETAAYIQYHKDTIEQLVRAGKLERCSFPIAPDTATKHKLRRLFFVARDWSDLLIAAGSNDIAEGRISEGIEKYLTSIQLAKHLNQHVDMMIVLSPHGIEFVSLIYLNQFVITHPEATEQYLTEIELAVANRKYDWSSAITKILDSKKLIEKNSCARFYQINNRGWTRFNRDPWGTSQNEAHKQPSCPNDLDAKSRRTAKSRVPLSYLFLVVSPEKLEEIVDKSYKPLYALGTPGYDWTKPVPSINYNSIFAIKLNTLPFLCNTPDMSLTRYHSLRQSYVSLVTFENASRLLVAIRRYKNDTGRWPDTLKQISHYVSAELFIDPRNGGEFVYKLTDESFTLYSKGKNGIDDGGLYSGTEDKVGPDDVLIWPFKFEVVPSQHEIEVTEY